MAKNKKTYELVKYNYTPNKEKKYSSEQSINLNNNGPYFSLEELDMDTCQYSLRSLIEHFSKGRNEKIGFAVKVTKEDQSYYLPAMFDAPFMQDIISKLKTNTINTISGKRTIKQVPAVPLVQNIWWKLRNLIEQKEAKDLKSIFGNSNFSYRLYSFMQNDYTSTMDKEDALYMIYQEFLGYETFRGAFVKMRDQRAKLPVTNLEINTKRFVGTDNYDKYYKAQARANHYNTISEPVDGHEEFLSPEEYRNMEEEEISIDYPKRSK